MRKLSQPVSQPERPPGALARISFKTPRRNGRNGARQIENGKKQGGFGSRPKLSHRPELSHRLRPSRALPQSVIGMKMNHTTLNSSFPRKETAEKASYRRRPVSRGANTILDRHHLPSLGFPLPVSHAKVFESGNQMPPSAISAPSAVNPRAAMRGRESTRLNRLRCGSITAIRPVTELE